MRAIFTDYDTVKIGNDEEMTTKDFLISLKNQLRAEK